MKIQRFFNVINDQTDLQQISEMVSVFNSKRSWHFQGSSKDSKLAFFISYLSQDELNLFSKHLHQYLVQYEPNVQFVLERAYINCNPAHVGGDWHTDGTNGITLLYYPNTEFDFNSYGGTDFEHHGIENYIKNSILIFPAESSHKAVAHKIDGAYRFSVAIKLTRI
jgi:hypothetical protein